MLQHPDYRALPVYLLVFFFPMLRFSHQNQGSRFKFEQEHETELKEGRDLHLKNTYRNTAHQLGRLDPEFFSRPARYQARSLCACTAHQVRADLTAVHSSVRADQRDPGKLLCTAPLASQEKPQKTKISLPLQW